MACLEPAYWTMILPLKVQENWNSSMINDNNYAFWEQTWEYFKYNDTADSSFPNGELVITLDKGFTVNIPRTELFETAKAINQTAGGWISQPGKTLIACVPCVPCIAANRHHRSHPNESRYGRISTGCGALDPILRRAIP